MLLLLDPKISKRTDIGKDEHAVNDGTRYLAGYQQRTQKSAGGEDCVDFLVRFCRRSSEP